jgi:DNA-binding MarR family transcriptional regulator
MARTTAARAKDRESAAQRQDRPDDAVDFGPLGNYIGFYLRLAQGASFAAFARTVGDIDLQPGRFSLLCLIGENPGISPTALSQANGRDKSTLTPALNDLERRGLVVRQKLAHDRRSYGVRLTLQGERMLRKLLECAARHDRRIDRIVGPRRDEFLATLRRLATELAEPGQD